MDYAQGWIQRTRLREARSRQNQQWEQWGTEVHNMNIMPAEKRHVNMTEDLREKSRGPAFIPDESSHSGDDSSSGFRFPPGAFQRATSINLSSGYDIRSRNPSREQTRRKAASYKPPESDEPGSNSLPVDDHKSSRIAVDEFGGGYRYKRTKLDSTVSSTISQDKTSGECARNAKLLAGFAQKSLRLIGPQGETLDTTSPPHLSVPGIRGTRALQSLAQRDTDDESQGEDAEQEEDTKRQEPEEEMDALDRQFALEYDKFQALTSPETKYVLGKGMRRTILGHYMEDSIV